MMLPRDLNMTERFSQVLTLEIKFLSQARFTCHLHSKIFAEVPQTILQETSKSTLYGSARQNLPDVHLYSCNLFFLTRGRYGLQVHLQHLHFHLEAIGVLNLQPTGSRFISAMHMEAMNTF